MMRFRAFLRSLRNALRGIAVVYRHEQSFRLQLCVTAFVIAFGFLFHVRRSEWIVLIFLCAMVLGLEMVNSVVERLIDAFKPRLHPFVADAKDIMAGAVLLVSLGAAAIGLAIFLPRLFFLFGLRFPG